MTAWIKGLFAAPPARRTPARSPLGVEPLAGRLVPATLSFANHVLTVTGTDAVDVAFVTPTGNGLTNITVTATTAGQPTRTATYPAAQVAKIVFDGRAGNDTFSNSSYVRSEAYGGAGNDTLRGGYGSDALYGGTGDDQVDGSFGDDTVVGSSGADVLAGGGGYDTLTAVGQHMELSDARLDWYGPGGVVEQPLSGFEHAVLEGTAGDDVINAYAFSGWTEQYGYGGDDALSGSNVGGDFIDGGWGDDTIAGFGGADELRGNDGDDKIYGGEGNDVIYGNYGRDELFGNEGDDFIDVGRSDWDVVYGGSGADYVLWNNHTFWGDDGGSLTGDGGRHGYAPVTG